MNALTRTLCASVVMGMGLFLWSAAHAQVNLSQEIVASNVTMIWEAQTYTPPFYKGKALYVDGASAKVLALPPASLGDPANLSYTWKLDGEVQQAASGVGRDFFIYEPSIFGGSPLIVVEVARSGTKVATGALRVPQVKPSIVLYPSLPLAGILFGNKASSVEGDEIALEAYPLFFGVTTKMDPSLEYKWLVGDELAQNPLGNVGRLILRSESGGSVRVGLSVINSANVLERAETATSLTFEE